jgi:hypothetical protein
MALSIGAKIKQIAGLVGTNSTDERTDGFITNMVEKSGNGARTSHLSGPQVEWIESIHAKHFGRSQG